MGAPAAYPRGPDGFEQFVALRGPALVRFASRLTGDPHRAEDLVQDALAKAYQRWNRIRRADRPEVYVRRILVNASNSWWRRRSSGEVPVDVAPDRPVRGDVSAEAADRDAMWRMILQLPARQRAVLVLRYYEDYDDATIAEILQCSQTTVRTHAMRALETLRKGGAEQ
jgi:RNA polymerase sigma-70 factor (sigma-E family)